MSTHPQEEPTRYRLLAEAAFIGTVVVAEGRAVDCSDGFAALYGYTRGEVTGKEIKDILGPQYTDTVMNGIASNKNELCEVSGLRKNGSIFFQEIHIITVPYQGRQARLMAVRDSTGYKQAIEELQINEERLELALSVINEGMFDWDVSANEIYFDPRYYTMAGYEPDEFPGTFDEWAKRVHPEDYKKTEVAVNAYLSGEVLKYDEEFRFRRKDGTWMWIRARIKIVERAVDGTSLRIVGVHTNIDKRKRAEQKLLENTNLLEESERVANLGSYSLDIPSMRWSGSTTLHTIFGIAESESDHNVDEWLNVIHPDVKEEMQEYLAAYVIGGKSRFDREYKIVRSNDGAERWLHGLGELALDGEGNPVTMFGTIQDITESKLAEVARERLETAINQSSDTVVITDLNGAIVYANPAFEKTTGYTCDEAIGLNPSILKSGKHDDDFYRNLWCTITSGKTWEGIFINKRKDGGFYEERATISPVVDIGGDIVHYVAVKNDVTAERTLERAQTFFRDATSHELRTPLTQLKLLQLLSDNLLAAYPDDKNAAKSNELVNKIYSGLDRILTATTLQSELTADVKVPFYQINVRDFLDSRVASAKHAAKEEGRNVLLSLSYDGVSEETKIMGNLEMIARAFLEVLSNAIKYTSDGDTIYVRSVLDGDSVIVEICNEGEAIPKESTDILFAPYSSIENILKHSTGLYSYQGGGIGLGLTISKMIMEYHRGSIKIVSDAEKRETSVYLKFLRTQ